MNRKILTDLAQLINFRYNVNVAKDTEMFELVKDLVMKMDNKILDTYFSGQSENGWSSGSSFETRATGRKMVDYINSLDNVEAIVDVGCGDNELKQYFPTKKFLGIDPYNPNADLKVGIEEINTERMFDVVLILGSLNFGDEDTINRQFLKAFRLCKPGGKIFLRANPGITHDTELAKWIDFYEWSHDKVKSLATTLGATVEELGWDHDNEDQAKWGNRIYAHLTKSPFAR